MMQWLRARARAVAVATLVSLTGMGGLSSAGHSGDCHDDGCAFPLLDHDSSSHGIGGGSSDATHPIHCILCHWTRSIRPPAEPGHCLARPATANVLSQPEAPGALSPVRASQPPPRSPPLQSHA